MTNAPWRTLGALVAALALLLSGVAYAQGASATGATEGSSLLAADDGGFEAKPLKVVLLGDSYSAGNGARNDDGDHDFYGPKDCYRSRSNWSEKYVRGLNAIGYNVTYLNRACSGGVTDDVLSPRKMDSEENNQLFLNGELTEESEVQAALEAEDPCGDGGDYPDEEYYTYDVDGFAPQYTFPDPTTLVMFTCTRYLAAQLDAINADTDLVLFTMGGNDIHFSDIIKQCFALGIRDVDGCRDKVETAKDDVTVVHDQLLAIFAEMRNRGLRDDAKVVLVSYPYLSLDNGYAVTAHNIIFQETDRYEAADEVRELGDLGDEYQQRAVDAANVGHEGQIHFLNTVKHGFNGHEPNGSPFDRNPQRWLFEFLETTIPIESYHPNPDGHNALASLLGNTAYGAGGALGGGNGGDIDIVLTIDTTGSMGSSIDQVKDYAEQLVDQISAVTTSARFALVTYGDHPEWTGYENDYASRVEQTFTANSTLVKEALAGIEVDGGGDWPEAMYSGIMAGLNEPWRPGVKKIVLVLADAPPHDPEPITGYTADDVIARAFAVDPAEVYVVNTGDATYGGSLSRVVEETGGSTVDAYSASDVPAALMEAIGTALAKPYAWAGGPYVALQGTEQALDANGSYAMTGSLVSYEWDFDGDSVYDRTTTGPTTRYTWPAGFDGTMAVRVTDEAGLSSVSTAHAASTPDGDEVPTAEDICPADSDPGQEDRDGDGIGDACDPTSGWPTEDKEGITIEYGDAADAAPVVDLRTPADGAAYQLGQSVVADFSCTDDVAVATCQGTVADGAAVNTATVGAKTFTVDAVDSAGHAVTAVHHFTVRYPFSGFSQPVDNPPVVNSVNAGRAIPVKFSLGGDRGLGILDGAPTSTRVSCSGSAPVDPVEQTTTSNSGLTYDPVSRTYNYVWKTGSTWAGQCRQLTVSLADGTTHTALFSFR